MDPVGQQIEPGSNQSELQRDYQERITVFESTTLGEDGKSEEWEEFSPGWGKPSMLKRSRPNVEDLLEYEE